MNKKEVQELVLSQDYPQLIVLAQQNIKKTFRYLIRLTYTMDDLARHRAVDAIGFLSAELSESDQEQVLDVIRRILWSMCDESGQQSWSGPAIIAEIIYQRQDLYGEFAPYMMNASLGEVVFEPGLLWSVGRIGNQIPYTKEILPNIINYLDSPKPELRGMAAWALGEIKASQAVEKLSQITNDENLVGIYVNGQMHTKTVADWAKESLTNISNS